MITLLETDVYKIFNLHSCIKCDFHTRHHQHEECIPKDFQSEKARYM